MTDGGPLWATETVSTYVYKRAFNWNTFDLGYPSAIARVVPCRDCVRGADHCFGRRKGSNTDERRHSIAGTRTDGMLAAFRAPAPWQADRADRRLHVVFGVAVPVGRLDVGAHDVGDQRQSLCLARDLALAKFRAWFDSHFATYFWNSTIIVVSAVAVVTLLGAAAAHCLARYRFRGNRLIYFVLFSSIMFPPQIILISLFQVCSGMVSTIRGWIDLVYVGLQLPLTVYLLEGFFARIPQDLFDAAKVDGYSDFEIFWRMVLPVAAGDCDDGDSQLHSVVERISVRRRADERRQPQHAADRHRHFMGDYFQDTGMIATGMIIAVLPVIVVYAFFSEKLIQGMTAGAVK